MLKKLWRDPVWSKVIAAIILSAITGIGTYLFNWWPAIIWFVKKFYTFAFASTLIQNWLLGLLGVLSLPTIVIVLILVWNKVFPSPSKASNWLNYRKDSFFGLRWRWKYFDDGEIYDIHTFCPHCDFQVYPKDASAYRNVNRILFYCEGCNQMLCEFQES